VNQARLSSPPFFFPLPQVYVGSPLLSLVARCQHRVNSCDRRKRLGRGSFRVPHSVRRHCHSTLSSFLFFFAFDGSKTSCGDGDRLSPARLTLPLPVPVLHDYTNPFLPHPPFFPHLVRVLTADSAGSANDPPKVVKFFPRPLTAGWYTRGCEKTPGGPFSVILFLQLAVATIE